MTQLPLSMSLAGDYISIRNFVQAIQDNRRSFSIESINFSLSQDRETRELRATLNLNAPYLGIVQQQKGPAVNQQPVEKVLE